MNNKVTLKPELASLIHHVKLHEEGWWNNAVKQILLTAIWASGKEMDIGELAGEVKTLFGVSLRPENINLLVQDLFNKHVLVQLPAGGLKLSEQKRKEFNEEIERSEVDDQNVKLSFKETIDKYCVGVDSEKCWQNFNEKFLFPTVQQIGARTYELISGKRIDLDNMARFPVFLKDYDISQKESIRQAISIFLDPQNSYVRGYILRNLNAYFFLEACNLSEENLQALFEKAGSAPFFKVFVDTNFLFSILGLHENPSNEAADSLMRLLVSLKGIRVKLYVFPLTVLEAKKVIEQAEHKLKNLQLTTRICQAMRETELDGITMKLAGEVIKAGREINASDYFRPYLTNLIKILKQKGLEIYNVKYDEYLNDDKVSDDINIQRTYELKKFGDTAKGPESLKHDVVMWHYINDKRPRIIESALDAEYWIVTVDFRFIAFDLYKRTKQPNSLPICVHPTSLVQMLQLWVPRTEELEKAVLQNLRLPCLFHEFDPISERVTIRILQALSRYENVNDLSEETIKAVLLNETLQQKIRTSQTKEGDVNQVKEALIEENKRIAEEKLRVEKELRGERDAHEETIASKTKDSDKKTEEINLLLSKSKSLEKDLEDERGGRKKAEQKAKDETCTRKLTEKKFAHIKIVLCVLLNLVLIVVFEYLVYAIPWAWLVNHVHSYGIQLAVDITVVSIVVAVMYKKLRKVCMVVFIAPVIIAFISVLGGPKDVKPPTPASNKIITEGNNVRPLVEEGK